MGVCNVAQYLSYAQYVEWGGTLTESAFNLAEIKARSRIDAMTQGRVARMAQVPEQVQAAMMEIITVDGTYSASAQASAPVAASFTTDGYSESYGSAETRTAAIEKQLNASIMTLLDGIVDDDGVPLIYAGVPTLGDPWPGVFIP